MNISELRFFLHQIGRRPNRMLSQNFLVDENIVSKILSLSEVNSNDTILEIGSGAGALTERFLAEGARVIAIEKDPVLERELSRFQTSDKRLTSICFDVLKFDFASLPFHIKVVANLPYHITTPILEKLIQYREHFMHMTLMMQSELAERLFASSGSKTYGSLSVFIQFYSKLQSFFKVSATSFYPVPKIDSKVLRFDWKPLLLDSPEPFFAIVRRAFQQRRKMIAVSLRSHYPVEVIKKSLVQAGAQADARPESLPLERWIAFFLSLSEAYPFHI